MRKPLPASAPRALVKRDNRVRIIGGRWRGRKLRFPDGDGLRPTGDRIRETLFNWLMPALPAARCLDLFAGSGALGFEALSRGAASCMLVERNPQAVKCLQDAKLLLEADTAAIIAADSAHWLSTATGVFDIVFIDPPFADASLVPAALVATLEQRGLLLRERRPENRRVVDVRISEDGMQLLDEIHDDVQECHRRQFGHLNKKGLRQLAYLLRQARQSHENTENLSFIDE